MEPVSVDDGAAVMACRSGSCAGKRAPGNPAFRRDEQGRPQCFGCHLEEVGLTFEQFWAGVKIEYREEAP